MSVTEVELGYEVGTGECIKIPIRHMVVTGQTQEAGKTTTLEALIARAGLPAVAFLTKRGERAFSDGRRIVPHFRERADWQYVSSVLEATMRERMKFERAWIMRVTKGATTLSDVLDNVKEAKRTARKGIDESMYLQLEAYLEIIVPRLKRVKFAGSVDLKPGLNVVDLADRDDFPPELQGLVMDATIRWIYEHANGAITIIPEAWEFLPQGRGSPVKLAAVELVRKGATLRNYVWLDSQDIGGVDKEVLRSCPVWLLGVQRETNEIKRVLDNIPAGTKKPKASDVALLKKGEFYACFGEHVIRTYVRPAWMSAEEAADVARGAAPRTAPPAPIRDYPRQFDDSRADPPDPEVARIVREAAEAGHQAGFEAGRRKGFELGYAAASSTIAGQVHGVIRAAEAFLAELRTIAEKAASYGTAVEVVGAVLEPEPELPEPPPPDPGVHADLRRYTAREPRETLHVRRPAEGNGSGTTTRLKTLRALAERHPIKLSRSEIAAIAGMAPRGGGFLAQMRELREHGLVEQDGKLYGLTPRGVAVAGELVDEQPKTTAELVHLWERKLPGTKGGEALRLLVRLHPDAIAPAELASALDMAPRGGGFLALMRHLRRAGLVEDHQGRVRASAVFFP